jgi:thioredoxin-like negative regulator of GroEL
VHAIVGAGAAGDAFLRLFRMSDAERSYRQVLAVQPRHLVANRRLAALLVMSGRRRESAPYLFELVRQGECDADELALLGNLQLIFDDGDLIEKFRKAAPDDPLPQLAAARIAMQRHETHRAAQLLTAIVARAPGLREAHINLGKALVELGRGEEFLDWHARLPADINSHPDVWVVRAQFAERRGEADVACRCYWEALREDPNLWQANYQLAALLTARGDDRAAIFLERANDLKTLADAVREVLLSGVTPGLALPAARTTDALGRPWEAWNWYRFVGKLDPGQDFAAKEEQRLESGLGEATPRMDPAANPALRVDFSSYSLPDWKSAGSALSGSPSIPVPQAGIRFTDAAEAAGIRFTYENGDDWTIPGMHTWESFGGGVAAFDFDGDGWPDLHFTQGGQFPRPAGSSPPADRLFRNLGDGRFADVTEQAGVGDPDYSQGVAAGDYDGDGFADLYVANIGRNRLYRNQGDGTFVDVTDAAGLSGGGWTASCLLADLNGDGFAEIYDVTYVGGQRPFTELCEGPTPDSYRICPPKIFEGEPDRLYFNRGDGSFDDVSASAGILAPDSKGLGGVAADFELTGRLNLFIANDVAANFYFVNETPAAGAAPQFRERAVVVGCAYNGVGRSQANMGIAVADADGDGLLDMYVSTFLDDYNVLFGQRPAGMFTDRTSEAGLMGPGTSKLGFGTQFLDANLDGWPDLVVTNGHVDDFSWKGKPFRMRPQFYVNLGRGRFTELPQAGLGEYFQREVLGRGLARLDWNRDGRDDFAVSHLDSPAALVTNQSPEAGHFLALQLRGVVSNRDAVGAVVWVTAEGRTRMQQITAGDGYYASNQKQLVFGLGKCGTIDEVLVRWPSGREQRFKQLSSDAEYLLVEGRAQPCRLPAPR